MGVTVASGFLSDRVEQGNKTAMAATSPAETPGADRVQHLPSPRADGTGGGKFRAGAC